MRASLSQSPARDSQGPSRRPRGTALRMPALAGRDSRASAVLEFDERGGGDKRKTVDYSFRQDVLGYTNVFLMFTWLFGCPCRVNRTHTTHQPLFRYGSR